MPELITEALLVTTPFVHAGEQYERDDRLPVRHRWVRRLARQHPDWFRMEYAPEDVDLRWLDSIEDESEVRYHAVLAAREAEKARRERALKAELVEQNRAQPELERAYAKQEAERKKREERMREEREREKVERDIEISSGYHF
jgi:hypothetical protein